MSAIDLVAFGWGRLRPLGGDRLHGATQLLRAVEMRLKTSGRDAGGQAGGGGGRGGGGGGGCSLGWGNPAARVAPP